MFTAYLYKTTDMEVACKQFLKDNFEERYIENIIKNLDYTEFVQNYLLKKEYLSGEILKTENQIAICIEKNLNGFDINALNLKKYPQQQQKEMIN